MPDGIQAAHPIIILAAFQVPEADGIVQSFFEGSTANKTGSNGDGFVFVIDNDVFVGPAEQRHTQNNNKEAEFF
jgi:hypothetical protein